MRVSQNGKAAAGRVDEQNVSRNHLIMQARRLLSDLHRRVEMSNLSGRSGIVHNNKSVSAARFD